MGLGGSGCDYCGRECGCHCVSTAEDDYLADRTKRRREADEAQERAFSRTESSRSERQEPSKGWRHDETESGSWRLGPPGAMRAAIGMCGAFWRGWVVKCNWCGFPRDADDAPCANKACNQRHGGHSQSQVVDYQRDADDAKIAIEKYIASYE